MMSSKWSCLTACNSVLFSSVGINIPFKCIDFFLVNTVNVTIIILIFVYNNQKTLFTNTLAHILTLIKPLCIWRKK